MLLLMIFSLETERLILRDFKLDDLEDYYAITQCPVYQTYYSQDDCSYEKAQELVSLFVNSATKKPRIVYQLAVISKKSQQFIGSIGIRLESNSKASIGCGFDTLHQGFGYAVESMTEIIKFGFDDLGIVYIYAKTIGQNQSAMKLCNSLGMSVNLDQTSKKKFKSREWDEVILELYKTAWL